MRRAERLFRLVNEMRSRRISRARELAAALEVSVATIYRDIAHLQASGLPIDGEAGVGYILRPGFDLPNVAFTHDQIDALAVGLSFVERTGDPVLATAAKEARALIQASLPSPEERRLADAPFYSLQPRRTASPHDGLVRRAIRDQRVVEIGYTDAAGHTTRRRLRPLVIWDLPDGWMVSGWCELRNGFRTVRHDRICGIDLTDDRFAEDERTGLIAFMATERCDA
ncbi:helix-turn-helix transcriptional regulator [Salinarimonas chemoclinalis]|uniref:helix-turn-helix transcriptional regulator n=1 Tax=Salinarimonas chemoclinalis TaxID=3241599 RepID=UPI0035591DBF